MSLRDLGQSGFDVGLEESLFLSGVSVNVSIKVYALYIYVYIHIHVYIYAYIYIYIFTCKYVCMYDCDIYINILRSIHF